MYNGTTGACHACSLVVLPNRDLTQLAHVRDSPIRFGRVALVRTKEACRKRVKFIFLKTETPLAVLLLHCCNISARYCGVLWPIFLNFSLKSCVFFFNFLLATITMTRRIVCMNRRVAAVDSLRIGLWSCGSLQWGPFGLLLADTGFGR